MSEVKFWTLLNNEILRVSGRLEDPLADFFEGLRNHVDVAEEIPAKLSYRACKFYRLKNPVSVVSEEQEEDAGKDFLDHVKQACREEINRVLVSPIITRVRMLATELSGDAVCLVIDFPDPFKDSNEAIGNLRREHDVLFECLQVTVETLGKWHEGDVPPNLQGGILASNIDRLPQEFRQIQETLAKQRIYHATDEKKRDFLNACVYRTQFNRIFTRQTTSRTVISDREFAAFYNILRCYDRDVSKITDSNSSSSLKTSNFTVHFIQPPFFSESDDSRGFKYLQEKSWSFPIFVDTTSARNVWRKFTPRSDWMVTSPTLQIPFVISEVISDKQESDRSRMLVEAITLARAGKFLLRSTSRLSFFVVAIYLDTDMRASRYIVMQTGRGNAEHPNSHYHDKAVCIHRKDFDLTNNEEEVDFLREMYNLATQTTMLSRDLDQSKDESLQDIKNAAQKVLSLSSLHPKARTVRSTVTDTITERSEGSEGLQDQDDLGVFEAEDIQNVLQEMSYKIEFIPWGHPELAVIVNKTGNKHGYLKFVERENEVKILQYLTKIESPSNHTVSGVQFWPVQGGTVISMPVAGGWLTSLDKPGEHLWAVALQLVESITFMHKHSIAHMDLKPQNVIIPSKGGRLSIIDFSVSIHVRGPDVKYTGVVGTEDYMAPEVRKGKYKPMLADLWSCGRTLETLCSCCGSSSDRTTLLAIATQLMDQDPEARPSMATVLEWMALAQRGQDNAVSPSLDICPQYVNDMPFDPRHSSAITPIIR